MLVDVWIRHGIGVNSPDRPRINAMLQHRDDHRDEEDREQRQRAHGGAEDAANDGAPTASGEVADHKDRHGTEGDAEPAHEAEEISAIELVGARHGEDDGADAEDNANDQGSGADRLYDWRSREIKFLRRRAHFDSSFISLISGATCGRVAPDPGSR